MQELRQSTAVNVMLGIFVDDVDGKTTEEALTLAQADLHLSKNGAAAAQKNDATSATHRYGGDYSVPLNATDTNTLGCLELICKESGARPIKKSFMVVTQNYWDSKYSTDKLQVDTVQIAGAVWDEILTGGTHNIATSAGRRVREIGAFAIESGIAQSGTLSSIKLAVTANDEAGVLNRNLIVLTDNTGKGQTRTIMDYNATTKVAIIDRNWRVIPDNTTAYQIVPDDTPLTVDHGIAQSGTSTTIKIREYASSINNAYRCNIVGIIAGKGRGQARLVGSYDGTSKVITICGEDWAEIPDATSVYVMMPYGTTCTSCLTDSALTLINAEIVDVLKTDTKGEPAQGAPGATLSIEDKIAYIYKFLKNKIWTTSTEIKVYNNAGNVVDHKSTISDDGTTFKRGEFESGP